MGRAALSLLTALAMLAVSCDSEPSNAEETAAGSDTPTVTDVAADEGDVEAYVGRWFDLRSDLEFEWQSHLREAADEQPDPPTVEFWRDVWLGAMDLLVAYTDDLEAVEPPPLVASEHRAYVRAARSLFTSIREAMAGFTNLEEFEGYHFEEFFSAPKLSADHQDALYQVATACRSLEERIGDVDLVCPPIAEVSVEAGAVWSATADVVPVGGPVGLSIINTGQEAIVPVVIEILEGDPVDLPMTDGVVDLSQVGTVDSGSAAFGLLARPGEIQPGEGVGIRIMTEFTFVVFDHRPGQFEAGSFVVIERSDRP